MSIVDALLASPEPAIRWMVRSRLLGESDDALRAEIPGAPLVRSMLAPLENGAALHPYAKWQGAHWVLGALAEIGHPPGVPNPWVTVDALTVLSSV